MTPAQAQALLTVAAAYDNRKPDPDAAMAWSLALDGYGFEDCRDAIVAHYRTTRDWIMPSDVTTAVKRTRGSRIENAPPPSPPPGLDPNRTGDYAQLAGRRAACDRRRPRATQAAVPRDPPHRGAARRAQGAPARCAHRRGHAP